MLLQRRAIPFMPLDRSWICFALPPLRDSCQEYGCQYFDLDPGQKASLAAPYDFLAED